MKFAYLDVGVEEFLVHWPLVDIQGVLHFEVYDYFWSVPMVFTAPENTINKIIPAANRLLAMDQ